MTNTIDLEKHISITSAQSVDDIIRPLREMFGIEFFRYLKLYKNGKRIVLSNVPDAIRYMYGQGNYNNLWYDGEFPEFLKPGWHTWHMNRLMDQREIQEKIENDLITILQVYHGVTLVEEHHDHYEIFSFDSDNKKIYGIDKPLLLRFIYYFKEQARKLIEIGEVDSILLPIKNTTPKTEQAEALITFLNDTKINRYYVGGKEGGAYLTAKEAACVRWMIEGKTAEEIAIIEGISPKTVQRHIENMKTKFNLNKQTQIIQLILQTGLLEHEVLI